jgi:hypothetical protein
MGFFNILIEFQGISCQTRTFDSPSIFSIKKVTSDQAPLPLGGGVGGGVSTGGVGVIVAYNNPAPQT